MNKLIFLSLSIPVLMLLVPNVFASDFSSHNQRDRPAINPDFDPDESCDLDAYQLRCIPGSEQDCHDIEGFAQNEDYTCHLSGECQEGYHGTDDDETGQCYPNSEGCDAYIIKDGVRFDFVLLEDRPDNGDRCADPAYLCSESSEDNDHSACKEFLERQEK
ncbi:MAG: hypothetical protein ACRD8W_27290 [Nitrososphaeraceae archaeon]